MSILRKLTDCSMKTILIFLL